MLSLRFYIFQHIIFCKGCLLCRASYSSSLSNLKELTA